MKRRQFLQGLGLATLSSLAPHLVLANNVLTMAQNRRILVLVELKGANDGLNTLIPYTSTAYHTARPNIAIPAAEVHRLSSSVGLHPALQPLLPAWQKSEMAWLQGLGYPDPNRSHFESIEIWDSGVHDASERGDGWVAQCFSGYELGGVAIDTNLGPLYGETCGALSVSDPARFIRLSRKINALQAASSNTALQYIINVQNQIDILASSLESYLQDIPAPATPFPANPLGRSLHSVYSLIGTGLNIPAYKVTLSGFDTHVSQQHTHANLLQVLAENLAALRANLLNLGMWNEVLVMTYSEFGRRLQENGSRGTDHGAASCHLLMGGKVRGGLYGEYPSLLDLDERGDLIYNTDFRDLYATIKGDWWGQETDTTQRVHFL
ncbi:MAG: DUF1501 domain-containing protein [Thiothrix sp.]|nr:DUF1501 domain-containing protein [Thiothrix sp.]HPE59069.1 DUF1501 domain-containing protein [Thiolinea sp.]